MIKVGILAALIMEIAEGRRQLDERVSVKLRHLAGGDGILRYFRLPMLLTVEDCALAMIALSDNMATNILIDVVGLSQVNQRLKQLGLASSRLSAHIPAPSRSLKGRLGVMSAKDYVSLMLMLVEGRVGLPHLSRWAVSVMERQQDKRAMGRWLLPSVRIAHKTGTQGRLRHDGGIIWDRFDRPAVVCAFFTDRSGPPIETVDHPGVLAIANASVSLIGGWALSVPIWRPLGSDQAIGSGVLASPSVIRP